MRLALVTSVALALSMSLAACGESSGDGGGTTAGASTGEVTAVADPGEWAALKRLAAPHSGKLIVPDGPSPEEVVIRDLKAGTGAPIRPGDTFAVRYVDFSYKTGEVLERSWQTPPWRLKWRIGELVDGWEPGLKGIKAGGVRQLIVPSRLAYGNGPRVYYLEVAYIERH